MLIPRILKTATLALAVLTFVAPVAKAQADFQTRDKPSSSSKKVSKDAPVQMFPKATRVDPDLGVTESLGKPINNLLNLVNSHGHEDEVIATGQKLADSKDAKKFDLALIYQCMGYAYLNKSDPAKGAEYLQKSISEDALSNNDQYQEMLLLANSQIEAQQFDAGLATLARVIAETKQDKPEYDGIRGLVFYEKKDYADAAPALQKALDASAGKPDPNVQQRLMASYFNIKQPERAVKVGEDILRDHPGDKDAMMNLANAYQEAGETDKAIAMDEDARKRGLLTTADDYQSLYILYANMKGHGKESAAVINEGLQKGILQPSGELYITLGDDYYFSDQTPLAIDAYKKADAASADGEAALNLAKLYSNDGKMAEAKAEAELALHKGLKHPEEARSIIERAGGGAKKPAGKK